MNKRPAVKAADFLVAVRSLDPNHYRQSNPPITGRFRHSAAKDRLNIDEIVWSEL
jgi:hypothetical protein